MESAHPKDDWQTCFRQLGPALLLFARRWTNSPAEAEDIVQDAFVKVAGRLVHLRDPGAFDAYLRRTVVNLSRSYVRRKMLERSFLKRESAAVARDAVRLPTSSLEDREVLWRALGRLSERQRAAIVLRFYEDLPEIQVAEILRCRPGTVKSLVSRGLKTLRHEMRGEPE